MTIFKDSQIAVDFGFLSFKKKLELKNKIINNGGILSYVLTKTSKCLVLCDLDKLESSYKCRMALKNGVPVVSPDFLDACIQAGDMIGVGPYLLGQQNKMESFKHGKIAANLEVKSQKKKALLKSAVQNIKMWASDDIEAPRFPENYHIAKWAVLTKSVKSSKVEQVQFQVLELHALDEEIRNTVEFPYRIFIHNGIFSSHSGVTNDTQEYCYVDSVEKAVLTFVQFYKKKTSPPLSFIRTMNLSQFPDKNFGSKNFYKIINDNNPVKIHPGDAVLELAEHIWQEAVGHVENLLPLGIDKLEPNKIVQAESSLLQIKRSLVNNDSKEKLAELSEDFRKALNLSKEDFVPITSKKQLIQNQDFCQLLKDIWSINESTNWKSLGARTKYSALHCDISCLVRNSTEYANIENMIFNSENWDPALQIHNVYKIERFIEEDNFVQEMDNKRLLFHGSAPQNLLGILFRGLLLPNILTEEFGGVRSDEGMLGNGIYFSDSPSYSLKFGHASKVKGTRFVFVHEVALGNCQDVYHTNFSLSQAPEGFDSIHGVKQKPESLTDFNDDEYVIYKLNQQRMKYLIEFSEMENPIKKVKFSLAEQQEEILESQVDKTIGVNDVKGVTDPLTNAKIGLIASGNVCLPLKSVHIKASLIDMVAKVIIFQAYTNDSNSAIEAKYVFPLSDLATVVGFEAFINNKHVVGKVKEKEIAHQEYKEAIDRGHGAYLMDQEAADVFTVSVGNLPLKASVLIKITYLEELSVEGECILFSLPGSMAPWKKDLAFSQVTQSSVPVIGMMDSSPQETTIEVAIEMPYAIRTISSPSHLIRIKRTDTYAMVETAKNSKLAEGFQLLIGLAEIHVPRMWVGNYGTDLREACMLTFYPEFVVNESTQVEIILLLDMSNSMRSNEVDSKKMALLILDFLPENCLFNIITFGQGYQEMFPSSQKALPRNIETAKMFIQNAMAQMGSTELLKPLKSFYLLSSNTSDLKNLFVISDGHFNDQHLILQLTKKCNSTVRVFSLGIGSTANKHVLRGLAKAGAGSFEFFDNKMKSKWEAKIKCLMSKTSQPVLTDVRVEWQQFNEDAPQPIQAPKVITSLFNGSRLVVYGFTSGCRLATLKAVIDGCEVSTIVSTPQLSVNEGMMLHQLTTKALIQDWEDGILHAEPAEHELLKKTNQAFIIELSKEYSVVSSLTSFVAVEERSKDEEISGDVVDFQELISQESSQMLDYLPWEDDLMTIADSNQEALLDYEAESDYCDSSEDDDMGFGEFDERSRGLSDNDYDPPSPSYAEDYCAMDSEASSSAVPRIIKHGDEVYEPRVAKMLSCPPARPVLKGGGWGDENDQNEVSSFAVRRIIKHGDEVYEPRVARRLYCPPARPVLRGGGWGDENNEKERDRTRKSAPPCSSQESEDESDQNEAMDSESYEEARSLSQEVASGTAEMQCLSMPLSRAPTFEECSVKMKKKKKKIAFEEESLEPLSKDCSLTPNSSKIYASVLCSGLMAGGLAASASFLANDLCMDGVKGPTDIVATSESTGEFSSQHPVGFGGAMPQAFAAPTFSFGYSAALNKPGLSPTTNRTEIGPPSLFRSSPQPVPKVLSEPTSRSIDELPTSSFGETNLNPLTDSQTPLTSLFDGNKGRDFEESPLRVSCSKIMSAEDTYPLYNTDSDDLSAAKVRLSRLRAAKYCSKPVLSPPESPSDYLNTLCNLFAAKDDNFSAGEYIHSQSMSHEVVSAADEMHCLSMPLSHAPTFEECSVGMTKKKKKIAFKEEESLKPLSKKCSVTPDSSKTYASVLCGSMNAGKPGASPASFLANDLCPDGVKGPTDIMATSESTGEFSSKHPIGFGGSMSHAFAAPVFSFGNSAALKKPGFSPATNNTEIGPPLLFGSSPQTVPKVIFGQTSRPMEELTTPSIGETNLNSLADLQTLTSGLFDENTFAFAACPPPAACPSAAAGAPPAASPTSLHTKRAPEPTTFSLRDKSHVVVSRSRHSYARRSKAPSKPVVSFAPTELPSPPKPPTNYFSYSSNLFQAEDDNFSAGDYINSQLIYLDSASGGSSDDSDSDDSIDRSQQSEDELPKTMNIDEANIFFSYIKNEPVSFLEPKYEPVSPVSINTPDSSIDVFNYQNELGFWEFGPEVDKFLGISSDQCRKQLYEAGLKSFGPDIEEDIQRLIATMMVVVILATIKSEDVLNVLEKSLIYQRSPFSIKDSDFSDFFKLRIEHLLASTPKKQHMASALEYIFKTVNKCSWVSDALHLSNNWWEAVYHFLSMDELDSVEYDSKSDDYWIKTR